MKTLMGLMITFSAMSAFAMVQEPVDVPKQLVCQEVRSVFRKTGLDAVTLEIAKAQPQVIQAKNNDLLIVDFTDGDQMDEFEFLRNDIWLLNTGKVQKINGLRRIGFYYADGAHTDDVLIVECSL